MGKVAKKTWAIHPCLRRIGGIANRGGHWLWTSTGRSRNRLGKNSGRDVIIILFILLLFLSFFCFLFFFGPRSASHYVNFCCPSDYTVPSRKLFISELCCLQLASSAHLHILFPFTNYIPYSCLIFPFLNHILYSNRGDYILGEPFLSISRYHIPMHSDNFPLSFLSTTSTQIDISSASFSYASSVNGSRGCSRIGHPD